MDDHDITWETLAAFVSGQLDDTDRARLEAAVQADPALARRAARLRELIETMEKDTSVPPPARAVHRVRALTSRPRSDLWTQWLETANRIVASLAYDSWQPSARLGLRGESMARHLGFTSPLGRLDLRLTPPEDGRRPWRVRGQAASLGDTCSALLTHAGTGDVVACAGLDAAGQFKLDVEPGRYGLSIVVDHASQLLVERLEVGGADEA